VSVYHVNTVAMMAITEISNKALSAQALCCTVPIDMENVNGEYVYYGMSMVPSYGVMVERRDGPSWLRDDDEDDDDDDDGST